MAPIAGTWNRADCTVVTKPLAVQVQAEYSPQTLNHEMGQGESNREVTAGTGGRAVPSPAQPCPPCDSPGNGGQRGIAWSRCAGTYLRFGPSALRLNWISPGWYPYFSGPPCARPSP